MNFIDFYLKRLKPIYDKSTSSDFIQYLTLTPIKIKKRLNNNSILAYLNTNDSLFKKYPIFDKKGERVLSIQHSRLRPYFNYANYLRGLSQYERQIKMGHKNIDIQSSYENNVEWKNQKIYNIARSQNLIVNSFKGIINRENPTKVELFEGLFANCLDHKKPFYDDTRKLNEDEVCTDWFKCLAYCDKAYVIPFVHGEIIYAWITFMEKEKEQFLRIEDWEKEYYSDYSVALDVFNSFTEEEKKYSIKNSKKHENILKYKFKRKMKEAN